MIRIFFLQNIIILFFRFIKWSLVVSKIHNIVAITRQKNLKVSLNVEKFILQMPSFCINIVILL